jgi:predicted HicB family RNase H-like nuclease
MNPMKYKNYTAYVEYDPDEGALVGKVVGTRDIVTFQAGSVAELQQEFERSVDVYLQVCQEMGKEPDRPYGGKFLVEVAPAVHRELAAMATAEGVSVRALTARLLSDATDRPVAAETRLPVKTKAGQAAEVAKKDRRSEGRRLRTRSGADDRSSREGTTASKTRTTPRSKR